MATFLPSSLAILGFVALLACVQVLAGFALVRTPTVGQARAAAWGLLVVAVVAAERLTTSEAPGFRMLALITCALLGMKAVALVEDRARGAKPLSFNGWLAFCAWLGMRPEVFATRSPAALPGAGALVLQGTLYALLGVAGVGLARLAHLELHSTWPATALLLVGVSFLLHFGLCNLLAGFWRWRGRDCRALFRAPLKAESLSEFWSRRWNLAFSEMTALAVYKPLAARWGRPRALLAGFVLSGLLHELAISVPVRQGLGLPLLYFVLHGALVVMERAAARRGRPVRGWVGRLWTVFWLVMPLPLLFHGPFLAGVLWPVLGGTQDG